MEIKNIRIKKSEDNPESAEVLAEAIIKIADGFEQLLSTPLTEGAIVQLMLGMPGITGYWHISKMNSKGGKE